MPPKKRKKNPLTQDQLAVYDFFIIRGCMIIVLIAALAGSGWILSELFDKETTESDKWKYSGLGAMVIWGSRAIIVHFFPNKKNND
ncbi:hypothetical protein BCY89_28025 [Sphingobacterium siyangense]|uniref:Uncharacterized protein n=1 Tax=Sphingobacterium siyangense TaxID=459529 RepID=A0A420FSW7_9SPHI|nr:hypothetical protein [Sphingobacterium siyangense]RKF36069.1 hypothetical protein BCY89_28025 [Sphingobacterium siyangense]